MATRLTLYNEALRILGERRLTSATEARDHRYHLDDAYDTATAHCLEGGFWNFAMRAVEIDAEATDPEFGFSFMFVKPDDWVRSYIVSPNAALDIWMEPLNDEAGYWFANVDPLYAKYVSNNAGYGMALASWPQTFADYVSARLALQVCPTVSSGSAEKLDNLMKIEKRALITARAKDAMNEPPGRSPRGTWANARGWGRGNNGTTRGLPS